MGSSGNENDFNIKYRSYKNFSESLFLNDIAKRPFHECSNIDDLNKAYDETTIAEIVEGHENHENIKSIRLNHCCKDLSFSFHSATKDDTIKIIQNMKPKVLTIYYPRSEVSEDKKAAIYQRSL